MDVSFWDGIVPRFRVQVFRVVFPILTKFVAFYITLFPEPVNKSRCTTLGVFILNTK